MANGSTIDLTTAAGMTAAFRNDYPGEVEAELFDKSLIEQILDQTGCRGLRIYNGINDSKMVSVLVGVDANGDDMTSGVIVEMGTQCPPRCSSTNALNS
jgi:hypothetical protein